MVFRSYSDGIHRSKPIGIRCITNVKGKMLSFGIFEVNDLQILYTHIINHYNPSVRIIDLVSHITYVVCVNFIHKWQNLQFKVVSERQIFWETFHCSFNLLSEFSPEICWEEGNRRRNTFRILFWCLAWCSDSGFSSNKPTHYLLQQGNFTIGGWLS